MGAVPIVWDSRQYRKEWPFGLPRGEWVNASENRILDHLPAVFIRKWNEFSAEKLRAWQRQIEARHEAGLYRFERLTSYYWVKRFRASAQHGYGQWRQWADGGAFPPVEVDLASGDPERPPPEREDERIGLAPLNGSGLPSALDDALPADEWSVGASGAAMEQPDISYLPRTRCNGAILMAGRPGTCAQDLTPKHTSPPPKALASAQLRPRR